jgi:hypothetical protein
LVAQITTGTLCTLALDPAGSARSAFFAAHPNSTYYADFRAPLGEELGAHSHSLDEMHNF